MPKEPSAWKLLNSTLVADCKVFKVNKERFAHPDGRADDFYVTDCNDWVLALALTKDNKIILVNQHRFGTKSFSVEPPGGVIDNGEDPIKAAERELLEETGYKGVCPILLASVSPNPAIMNNKSHIVLIKDCIKISDTNFDKNEEISTKLYSLNELDDLIYSGRMHHSLAINAVYLLQKHLRPKAS